jgi:putative ABC transport system ATP-binding protein
MQRVAIARALMNDPILLLGDEPTGNLDGTTGQAIGELFSSLHSEGITIVIATHNESLASLAQRKFRIADGTLSHVSF